MSELTELLDHIGYSARPQQTKLYELLTGVTNDGVIVQAGTGTGKSIAVLAAAAHAYRKTGIPSLVVTPTRVLMDQYMASDVPAAAEAFGLTITELRGKRWYHCDLSSVLAEGEDPGCLGRDVDCSMRNWLGLEPEEDWRAVAVPEPEYRCDYQAAKFAASRADIVVTNSDFWIINDRTLPEPIFDLQGAVFVDESHQLEAKLKDYAGRSVREKELRKHYEGAGIKLARSLEQYRDGMAATVGGDVHAAIRACWARGPGEADPATGLPKPGRKLSDRALELQEALSQMLHRLDNPSQNCLIWSDGWSIKMEWIDISPAAHDLLTARPFGLVSATIPSSMPSALGVPDVKVEDVGHPFDYASQATVRISEYDGSYRFAQERGNKVARVNELWEEIERTEGGCLLLFSAFKDLEFVYDELWSRLRKSGRPVLRQNDQVNPRSNADLAAEFKAAGNAVLFGSESFATGFDVPGDALQLVSIWKMPFPGKDPVTDALARRFFPRYKDLMLTRVVQAAGRLIRTTSDTGRLFIADSRAEQLLTSKDMMVRHLGEFGRH